MCRWMRHVSELTLTNGQKYCIMEEINCNFMVFGNFYWEVMHSFLSNVGIKDFCLNQIDV